jgi:hypothetical protein
MKRKTGMPVRTFTNRRTRLRSQNRKEKHIEKRIVVALEDHPHHESGDKGIVLDRMFSVSQPLPFAFVRQSYPCISLRPACFDFYSLDAQRSNGAKSAQVVTYSIRSRQTPHHKLPAR